MDHRQILLWQAMRLGPIWQLRQPQQAAEVEPAPSSVRAADQFSAHDGFDETEAAHAADILFIGDGFDQFDAALAHHNDPLFEKIPLLYAQMAAAVEWQSGASTHLVHVRQFYHLLHQEQSSPSPALNEEQLACHAHLRKQLAVIRPRVMVVLGRDLAAMLLHPPADVHTGEHDTAQMTYAGVPLLVSENLQQVLARPTMKRQLWRDLCLAMEIFQQSTASTRMA